MALRLIPAFAIVFLLAGCGSDEPAPPPAPAGPKLVIPPPSDPPPPGADQPGKGLGLSEVQIMKGIDEIKLDDADLPSNHEGNTFMGHTADFTSDGSENHAANLVAYGYTQEMNHLYFTGAALFDGKPELNDYTKRNLAIAEKLLGNVFGSPLPDDIKNALEFIQTTPDRKKWVQLNGKIVLFAYRTSQKDFVIDIK